MSNKEFTQNGVARNTQFGKGGCRIRSNAGAPSGERLEARSADSADPQRMAGAQALEPDDFTTLSQLNSVAAAQQVSATNNVDTTSGAFILIPGMTLTPSAGTYITTFSAQVQPSIAAGEITLFVGGGEVEHARRNIALLGGQSAETQALVTVNGVESIEAHYRNPGGGDIDVFERSLIILRVN